LSTTDHLPFIFWNRQRKEGIFYPTRLALGVASGLKNNPAAAGALDAAESSKVGFIIVETNYRVYAYTDSELPVSLLALFSEVLHRCAKIKSEKSMSSFFANVKMGSLKKFVFSQVPRDDCRVDNQGQCQSGPEERHLGRSNP
jgi:hypothetical protein